jgi:hypothetical protein
VRKNYPGVLLGLVHEGSVVVGVEQDPVIGNHDAVLVLIPEL